MPLIFNGSAVPQNAAITYNGVRLTKIIFGSTVVWVSARPHPDVRINNLSLSSSESTRTYGNAYINAAESSTISGHFRADGFISGSVPSGVDVTVKLSLVYYVPDGSAVLNAAAAGRYVFYTGALVHTLIDTDFTVDISAAPEGSKSMVGLILDVSCLDPGAEGATVTLQNMIMTNIILR